MERREDYRHPLCYALSLKERRTRRIIDHLETETVSATGLSFRSGVEHGLARGDHVEVQLVARVPGETPGEVLVMATDAVVVRAAAASGAVRFSAPLAF